MSNTLPLNRPAQVLLLATGLLALLIPLLSLKPIFVVFLVLIYYLFFVLFLNNKLGLYLLIFVRPLFDLFYNEPIAILDHQIKFSFIVGGLTLFFAIYVVYKNSDKIKKLPLLFPVFLFLTLALVSCFSSTDFSTSMTEWLRLLSIFSLYALGFILVDTTKDFINLIKFIILSALVPSAFAIYQYMTGTGMSIPFEGIYNRIYGTFAHPNLFAYYLVLSITLTLFIFLISNRKKVPNMIFIALMPFLMTILILTFTRGAWLALMITIALIGAIKYRKLLLILFIASLIIFWGSDSVNSRIRDLLYNPYNSIQWRIQLWQDSFGYAMEKKFTGHGTGVAKDLILDRRGESFGSSDPHNDYLKITIENGLPGVAVYLLLIISLLVRLIIKYKNAELANFKILILLTFSLTISIYAMSFADNILRNTALQWSYWALIGGLFAIPTSRKNF